MITDAHIDYESTSITFNLHWRVIGLIAATIICIWLVCILIRRRQIQLNTTRKMKKWTKKRLLLMVIWYCCYIASLQFFRLKFGLYHISIAFLIIGIAVVLIFGGSKKPESN